jgi:hypothetical protein
MTQSDMKYLYMLVSLDPAYLNFKKYPLVSLVLASNKAICQNFNDTPQNTTQCTFKTKPYTSVCPPIQYYKHINICKACVQLVT